jgi:hypothetical protein
VLLRFTISVFLLLSCLAGFSQQPGTDSLFNYRKSIEGIFSDFTIDNLGNLYLVNQNGQLKKLTATGDSVGVFNNVRQYGKIDQMDVSNPLKLLLYFKDFGTILILDRFLNTRGTIDLRKQQLFQVRAIGQSYDNNIWVFDELENKLKRIGEDGRVLDQSTDFRLLFDSTPSPQFIVDQNRQLYLYDSVKGVYLFDYYGAFKNRIQLRGWSEFTVIANVLYGRDSGMLYKYEPGTLNLQQYVIPAAMRNAKKIKFSRDNLYLLRDDRLEIYAINLRQ